MRSKLLLVLVAIVLSHPPTARADDELFSQLAMESVFEKTPSAERSQTGARPADTTEVHRVTGVSSLLPILKATGQKHSFDGNVIEFDLESAGWIFPVKLRVDIERERLLCDLGLVAIKSQDALDRDAMLKLMAAGDPAQSVFFAFDPAEKLVQLRASLSNRNVTASGLKADLERLGRFADSQSALWSKLGTQTNASQTPQPAGTSSSVASNAEQTKNEQPAAQAPTNRQSLSIQGRWSARITSGEAFAVQFDSNGRFNLVHLKAGKSTKSTGRAIRSGEQIVLQGDDGVKLTGSLIWRSANEFQLTIQGAGGKPAARINFKKQS